MSSMKDLRILVTGATSGIGRVTAQLLAAQKAVVLVHGRDVERVRNTVDELVRAGGRASGFVADLASLKDAARLARDVAAAGGLDVLINNAGVGFGADRGQREVNADGLELRFALNYLAPYVLTHELLQRALPSRAIVNLASIGQAELAFDDLLAVRDYDGVAAYRRSKLAMIMWTFDLAAAHKSIASLALHPGTLLDTGMVREAGIAPHGPVQKGGDSTLFVLERALSGVSGRYFDETREGRALPQAYDLDARLQLHEATLALVEPFISIPT